MKQIMERRNMTLLWKLRKFRAIRGFNVETYVKRKIDAINKFFTEEKLDSVVLGISGGVDSAVVYALFDAASKVEGSPIKEVLGLVMPINCGGTTGQDKATERAIEFLKKRDNTKQKLKYEIRDLTGTVEPYVMSGENAYINGLGCSDWSIGQLASIIRTPMLYFAAAKLQELGYKSIVSGTTNRDEGSYIGFYGKASDGMNDIQPIADIHKSEVYQVAKYLNVTDAIINEAPRGDVYDNRVDEEMIGAPYEMLELFLLEKEYGDIVFEPQETSAYREYCGYCENIESLHQKNAHKYKVGYPARFIDVMPRKVVGGWQ